MTLKERMHQLIDTLPDPEATDAAIEELHYRLYVLEKVEKGLQELDAGKGVPHEQARKELARWLSE
ncbi:MAG: hypothetical protein QM770_18165 [Tepidisphaeraceae bacterium]